MKTYIFHCWYRYGNFEKEFDIFTVEAESEEAARKLLKETKLVLRRLYFKIELRSIN